MDPSLILLRRYVNDQSEPAFREVVSRHAGMVYQAALRWTGGDEVLAQDVAQAVFTDLAWKAGQLPRTVVVSGWLYRHTGFVAAHLMRAERRRRQREHRAFLAAGMGTGMENSSADGQPGSPVYHLEGGPEKAGAASGISRDWEEMLWRQMMPVLDEAMGRLAAGDRDALVLRFLEGRALREVGEQLGLSENSARMRVNRALEKLRRALRQRGVTDMGSAAALGAILGLGSAAAVAGGGGTAALNELSRALASAALTSSHAAAGSSAAATSALAAGKAASLSWWVKGLAVAGMGCGMVVMLPATLRVPEERNSGENAAFSQPSGRSTGESGNGFPEKPPPAAQESALRVDPPPPVTASGELHPSSSAAVAGTVASDSKSAGEAVQTAVPAAALPVAKLRLGVIPGVMKFDPALLTVKPGQEVALLFKNAKCPLQHNFVLVNPGKLAGVGAAADAMLSSPAAVSRYYIPASPDIVAAGTKLVGTGQYDLIKFTAPAAPGDYPYLCTFPGHWRLMHGILRVAP